MSHHLNYGRSIITPRNVTIVVLLAAAAAGTYYVLKSDRKNKRLRKIAYKENHNNGAIQKLTVDLQNRRDAILKQFEESKHRTIPKDMDNAMELISSMEPTDHPPAIRLLCSQLIQDYAIMHTNVTETEPRPNIIEMAKSWLDFAPVDIPGQVEQINHRYALALRSRSIKEFKYLQDWLARMDPKTRTQDSVRQNWILRNFQCACLLGNWDKVSRFGKDLESIDPESLSARAMPQQAAPLHPLHLFEYIALKLPNQSANFTQVYYNCQRYAKTFDPRLSPPLKFSEWQIKDCTTWIKDGFSTNGARNDELGNEIASAKAPRRMKSLSRYMFVYGCLIQFPCFWVQLPASNAKLQPVVLCGPWNDTEMELTASYVRRLPDSYRRQQKLSVVNGVILQNNDDDADNPNANAADNGSAIDKNAPKMVTVVRSDLRLHLERGAPCYTPKLPNGAIYAGSGAESSTGEEDVKEAPRQKSPNAPTGWTWIGTFEHNEGTLAVAETRITSFDFRKDLNWHDKAEKFTMRSWQIEMIIASPD